MEMAETANELQQQSIPDAPEHEAPAEKVEETEPQPAKYRTLSDVLEAPARESMATIARIAPAIEIVARKSGIIKMVFNDTMAIYQSSEEMSKLNDKARQRVRSDAMAIGEEIILKLLRYGLGECLPEMQEIIAAIQGITVDELLDNYSTAQIIGMVKAVVQDKGFLASLRTVVN